MFHFISILREHSVQGIFFRIRSAINDAVLSLPDLFVCIIYVTLLLNVYLHFIMQAIETHIQK